MYLPPPSTESPIVIHPPDDFDMSVYLPPFNEELPPPQNDPPQNYLPPENVSKITQFSNICHIYFVCYQNLKKLSPFF